MLEFYNGKRVLITGHTGFKGTWLSRVLLNAGAFVTGYGLEPNTSPNLFSMSMIDGAMKSIIADVGNLERLKQVFEEVQPEIVFHLAAQPIVREGYNNPVGTYETNVMGTVHVLECARYFSCVKSLVNVTTDKVYQNNEWSWGYRENDILNGYDPYSNSKSCSELVTQCYRNSFFQDREIAISTARAGNVIGGGDFANDRIIPDCVKAIIKGKVIQVRNPHSIRPYQHVLEPLAVYLYIAAKQYEDYSFQGCYNVGPDDCDCVTTGELVSLFCEHWGDGVTWESSGGTYGPHEANLLKLDCSKLKTVLQWKPQWHIDETIDRVCKFYKAWLSGADVPSIMDKEITDYFGE